MEYLLINQDEHLLVREPVSVKTVRCPKDWTHVYKITVAVRCKLIELIRLEKKVVVGELDVPIASMPPDSGDRGCEFYVHADMFAMLKPIFVGIVWECIHDEVGNELDD